MRGKFLGSARFSFIQGPRDVSRWVTIRNGNETVIFYPTGGAQRQNAESIVVRQAHRHNLFELPGRTSGNP